jgi:uncharacterized protein YaeQ
MTVKNKTRKTPKRRRSYHGQPDLWVHNNKRYYAIWTENGKTKTKSLRTTDNALAKERLREFSKQREAGNLTAIKVPTVHEAVAQWQEWRQAQVADRTLAVLSHMRSAVALLAGQALVVAERAGEAR